MKRKIKTISIMLASAMILSLSVPMTAMAETDDSLPPIVLSSPIEKRAVTAYRYSMDDSTTIECIFTADLPDMPYIRAIDYLSNVFIENFTETKNDDGTYTISTKNGSMVVNTEADTVYFESFENFFLNEVVKEGTSLDAPYVEAKETEIEGEENPLTLDYGKYGIDIIEDDDMVYFPLASMGDLFFATYNNAEYIDDCIYFIHSYESINDSYMDRTSVYEKNVRSPEMAAFAYNELCFNIDNLYGRPSKSAISPLIEEMGLDKALDEFNDGTKIAKSMLKSEKLSDFIIGLSLLNVSFDDGGHTAFYMPFINIVSKYPQSPCATELQKTLKQESTISMILQSLLTSSGAREQKSDPIKALRNEKYGAFELVKKWEDDTSSSFYKHGDTGVFVFDSFKNNAVYNFKWALDYSVENGIKNFIIDVSCNTGGSTAVVSYMIAAMTNKKYHKNKQSIRSLNTLTGAVSLSNNMVDLNLDDVFDDKDKDVAYDLNFGVITSSVSYSCGNLFPIIAKDEGIPIFGELSGGGACILSIFINSDSLLYTMSGYRKFITANGSDADLGAALDYDLTKTIINEDGSESVDYSEFYDIDNLGTLMNEFYSTDEPSQQQSEEPSEEPSQQQSEEPSVEPSQQSEEPSNTPSQIVPDPGKGPVTGDSTAPWMIALLMTFAAGTVFAVIRRKNRTEK